MGISAVNTGNNLIYLIVSSLLAFMSISGFFGKRNLSKIDIDIECPHEIYANKEFPVKIKLKNSRNFLPVFLMDVKVKIDRQSLVEKEIIPLQQAFFPFGDLQKESTKYINISFKKRGKYEIKDIYLCSVFPFNFFIRCKKLTKPFEFIVFPEPKKCESLSISERERQSKGEKLIDKTGFDSDMLSIREYIHGDPFKYINWKATAKTGELKTKELSSLAFQPVVINFEKSPIKNIEERLSCITYTVLQLLKKNIPVGLKIKDKFYKPNVSNSHKITILKELALYE